MTLAVAMLWCDVVKSVLDARGPVAFLTRLSHELTVIKIAVTAEVPWKLHPTCMQLHMHYRGSLLCWTFSR